MDGCRKVEVLRNEASVPDNFMFDDKCSNFPEGVRWTRTAHKYKTRFVPKVCGGIDGISLVCLC